MAKYFIFHTDGSFGGVASNETQRDYLLTLTEDGNGTAVTPTDAQWNANLGDTKSYRYENSAIVEYDNDNYYAKLSDETDDEASARWLDLFKKDLQSQKDRVSKYLKNNTSSEWAAYLTNLNSVDPSTVSLPIDSFQKWFNSQSGFSSLSIKELP